ncbi:MAG: PEP-CTERM sorting domain-containing protein [Planctomycetes bacterium]|nr:PEP-CTERM sorting domain-containing protein [Planctomycetota bacterium]
MRNLKLWLWALATVGGLSLGQAVEAGPIVGSEALGGAGTTIAGSTDVTTATSVSWTAFTDQGTKTGDFTAVPDFEVINGSSTLELQVGAPVVAWTFGSASWGTFTETSIAAITIGANAITVYVQGTFVPGTDFDGSITGNTATMVLQMNQAGGAGNSVSTAATLTTPALTIPEPTSIALFGSMIGLVGLGLIRRNRRS